MATLLQTGRLSRFDLAAAALHENEDSTEEGCLRVATAVPSRLNLWRHGGLDHPCKTRWVRQATYAMYAIAHPAHPMKLTGGRPTGHAVCERFLD